MGQYNLDQETILMPNSKLKNLFPPKVSEQVLKIEIYHKESEDEKIPESKVKKVNDDDFSDDDEPKSFKNVFSMQSNLDYVEKLRSHHQHF